MAAQQSRSHILKAKVRIRGFAFRTEGFGEDKLCCDKFSGKENGSREHRDERQAGKRLLLQVTEGRVVQPWGLMS